jgi:hypothetical protein
MDKTGSPRRDPSDDLRACAPHPPDRPTRLLVRRPRARARFEERRAVLHCDCDEEARPRSGYRPGAPGGRQVEHVDEHLRAAAWMGASPLPPAWCRFWDLHAGRDHHSRDRGCRDRAHRSRSQPRLTPRPLHPRILAEHRDCTVSVEAGRTAVGGRNSGVTRPAWPPTAVPLPVRRPGCVRYRDLPALEDPRPTASARVAAR